MKRVAFVFSTVPHGSSSGREGLDALLATSALTEDLGVFFIGDGVFQILQGQQPDVVLARDYIATFKDGRPRYPGQKSSFAQPMTCCP